MQIEVLPPYLPLVNAQAQARFAEIVQPGFVVFEYGSGKSTIWFAQHCERIISIENSPRWFEAVGAKLNELDLWEPVYITQYLVEFDDKQRGTKAKAEEYAAVITRYPDNRFDLVYIDGKARPLCIRDARAKVKSGGWLVADDTHWKPVKDALWLLDGWEAEYYRGRVDGAIDGNPRNNATGFFRKPEGL